MKTIIGTKQNVTKELTALVADVLAHKPEANIAVSVVDLPEEVLGALAKSDLAFDKATLFQACEYCGAAGKGVHAVGAAFQVLTAAKPFAAVHAPDPDADAEHAADYDAAIQAAGGLDLVILGLGERGHVAFTEPGAGFGEKTHIAKLAEVTREAIAAGRAFIPSSGRLPPVRFADMKSAARPFRQSSSSRSSSAVRSIAVSKPRFISRSTGEAWWRMRLRL